MEHGAICLEASHCSLPEMLTSTFEINVLILYVQVDKDFWALSVATAEIWSSSSVEEEGLRVKERKKKVTNNKTALQSGEGPFKNVMDFYLFIVIMRQSQICEVNIMEGTAALL